MKNVLFIFFILFFISSFSQDKGEDPIVIQFSGIVITGDSAFGVPHVLVYVPKSMRGTESNDIGYFTMPALAGDSVVIKHIGYKTQYIVLPDGIEKQSYTYIVDFKADTSEMAEINIFPYPTYQLFKQAFVNADIPKDDNEENWKKNLDKENMKRMMMGMTPSGYESYRTYTLNEVQRIERGDLVTVNPLTNVFAWISLIQEINKKRKVKKKEKEKDADYSEF